MTIYFILSVNIWENFHLNELAVYSYWQQLHWVDFSRSLNIGTSKQASKYPATDWVIVGHGSLLLQASVSA